MIPDREKVRVWEARAPAYDRLCRRWEIFSQLSNRLIDLLPANLHGRVLDIGAGSGLTSQLLLDRHPRCESILIEPSEAMLALARARLAGRPTEFFAMGLDSAPLRDRCAVAALASASMQFLDFDPACAALARLIEPGGHFAFNLWWHHWEDTKDRTSMKGWEAVAEAACRDEQLPPPEPPAAAAPRARPRSELASAARAHGFRLLFEHCDEYPTPIGFGVDFEAMDPNWPIKGLAQDARQAVLKRMHERAEGKLETLVSTRFLLRRGD